jgi:hypothetical protein
LFFGLRQKAKKHKDFQHNVLFRLRKLLTTRNLGDAVYVCPLILNADIYILNMHRSAILLHPYLAAFPITVQTKQIRDRSGKSHYLINVPLLDEHVVIPPHVSVTEANHYYSFTDIGTEVAFHSPERLIEETPTFAQFIERSIADYLLNEKGIDRRSASGLLAEFRANVFEGEDQGDAKASVAKPDDPFEPWLDLGAELKAEHGIEQFAMVRWEA